MRTCTCIAQYEILEGVGYEINLIGLIAHVYSVHVLSYTVLIAECVCMVRVCYYSITLLSIQWHGSLVRPPALLTQFRASTNAGIIVAAYALLFPSFLPIFPISPCFCHPPYCSLQRHRQTVAAPNARTKAIGSALAQELSGELLHFFAHVHSSHPVLGHPPNTLCRRDNRANKGGSAGVAAAHLYLCAYGGSAHSTQGSQPPLCGVFYIIMAACGWCCCAWRAISVAASEWWKVRGGALRGPLTRV